MMMGSYNDYRDFLKDTLESRIQKNARYSMRAFARDLQIAPQNLSLIFKKKKGISLDLASRLGPKLGLNEQETSYFCDLVDLVHSKSPSAKAIVKLRLARYKQALDQQTVREDVFRSISDWYHYAVLELTYVKSFRSDTAWIAKKLHISQHEAQQAVDRLLRLGLLTQTKGRLKKAEQHLTTTHDIPSEAIRNFNRQILLKAADALSFQPLDRRDLTTMTMAIDVKKIEEAKKRIRKFRHELTEYLETGDRQEVYCLAIQLFGLTEKE